MSELLEYENGTTEVLHISNTSLIEEDSFFENNRTIYGLWSNVTNSTISESFAVVGQSSTSFSVTADTISDATILNPVNGTDSTNMRIQFNRSRQSLSSEPASNESLFWSTKNWQNETQNSVTESVRTVDSFVTQNLISKESVEPWINVTDGSESASTSIRESVPLEISRNPNPTNGAVSNEYSMGLQVDTTLSPDSEVETLKGFSFRKNLTTKPYEKTDNTTQWRFDPNSWTLSYTEEESTRESRLEADSGDQTGAMCLDQACVLSGRSGWIKNKL